jgi:YHS domain-containing protein
MKLFNRVSHPVICGLALGVAALASTAAAADTTDAPPKPDRLTICPVSGDKLGEMGKPHVFVYQGQEVRLCCPDCKKDFDKDPAKYLKKIRAADKNVPAKDPAKN